jgi:glutaredoxin 3
MADIEIYSTAICPYCNAAKNLLRAKGLAWRELRIDTDPDARKAMAARTHGARTVPQIFINGILVGGFDQLAAAEHSGKLNELLGTAQGPEGAAPA